MNTISYAVPVWNEHFELNRLLGRLVGLCRECDEIVVQGDQGKVTEQVVSVLRKFKDKIIYIEYPLNKDYATYKNNLFKHCTKDYIFQVDADEELPEFFDQLPDLIGENQDVDLFVFPRKNVVVGITDEYVQKMGWKVTSIQNEPVINWPDPQARLFKNGVGIHLVNKVHELPTGYKSPAFIPNKPEYAIIHTKTLERQIKQNNFYESIV